MTHPRSTALPGRGQPAHVVGNHLLSHGRSPPDYPPVHLDDMIGNVRDAVAMPAPASRHRWADGVGFAASHLRRRRRRTASGPPSTTSCSPLRESLSVTRFPNALGVGLLAIRRVTPPPVECCLGFRYR